MATCHDPRHAAPCPMCEDCSACVEECLTDYWIEDDGTPWGEVGLRIAKVEGK